MLDVVLLTKCGHSRPLTRRQVMVVPSICHRNNRPSFLIWIDDHATSWSRLEVIDEHPAIFKALGEDSRREIQALAPNFASSRRTVAVPFQSFLEYWRINVQRLLRMTQQAIIIYYTFSVIVCTSVHTFVIIHPLLDCEDSCARHPVKVCNLTNFESRL